MVNDIEYRVYEYVRPYAGKYLFSSKDVELKPETDLDTDLHIDEFEIEDFMNGYFSEFNVDRNNFNIKIYFPDISFSWNPFKKNKPVPVPDFTIGMLIESAKAKRWLYK